MQEMTTDRSEIFALFHKLADEANIPMWDYSTWNHDGDKWLFYNSQHLNATGAELFSDDLAARLHLYLDQHAVSRAQLQVGMAGTLPQKSIAQR
jgi:hypothetical protein